MSGGVDSAVAALLQRAGRRSPSRSSCGATPRTTPSARAARPARCAGARAIAHGMGLAHFTLDLRDEFRAGVVEPWLADHAAGLTPNPCVRCNGNVRLDAMLAFADRLGAATLTTGHYARRTPDGLLRLAADPAKDQAYMLAGARRARRSRGCASRSATSTKPQVRAIAAEHELPVASKPDSQDLCFLAGTGRAAFLARHGGLGERPGDIVDARGRVARPPPRRASLHRRPAPRPGGRRRGGAALRAAHRRAAPTPSPSGRARRWPRAACACATRACTRRPPRSSAVKLRYRAPAVPCTLRGDTIELHRARRRPRSGPDRGLPARRRRAGMRHNRCVTSDEIRELFLGFFEERDHLRLPSGSLVPASYDPSVLLTTAGMQPLKPYFLGIEKPPHPLLTTCQKSFRTVDIENVGTTTRHLTFFEMLGNFSIGDYFKQGAAEYAWELSLDGLRLQPRRHLDHGLRGRRRARPRPRRGGHRGVGGDRRPARAHRPAARARRTSGRPGRPARAGRAASSTSTAAWSGARPTTCPGGDNERFLEYWNLVFMQYDQDPIGTLTPLPAKNIDTGLGLNRMALIQQGVDSIFETDQFAAAHDARRATLATQRARRARAADPGRPHARR